MFDRFSGADPEVLARKGEYLPLPDNGGTRRGRREAPEHRGGGEGRLSPLLKKLTLKSRIFCILKADMISSAFPAKLSIRHCEPILLLRLISTIGLIAH